MIFDSIVNRGEFFSNHYLDTVIGNDLGNLRSRWDHAEGRSESTARSRLRALPNAFFAARAAASEATSGERRVATTKALNDVVLTALGFSPDRQRAELPKGDAGTVVPTLAHDVETSAGRLLVALDAGVAADVDDLFDDSAGGAGRLLDPFEPNHQTTVSSVSDAIGELFAVDDPPRYVLVAAGRVVLLADRGRWAEGRFLAVDLDAALERRDIAKGGELETIAALFSADALIPSELGDTDGQSAFEELVDKSQKHAVGVSKELRDGIRHSVELLANEVIAQRLSANLAVYTGPNAVDPKDLTRQCLRWLYRLLVLLYAESRPELGVLPVNDDAYVAGYSLDRLRDLLIVDLQTDRARNGSHLHQSLQLLFDLANDGYHAEEAQHAFVFDIAADTPSSEDYLQFPGLDAALFDSSATPLLDGVTLRNETLQRVLALLMLSPESKGKKSNRGFISYAQLGINQLGAMYEGLMAYTGFFADRDLFEVAKNGDPEEGTWVLPVADAEGYPENVFVSRTDAITGRTERIMHTRGSFVFRLSGRDRQRSASYYTPEVLTRCVVKHALAELLGLDDYAPEHGSTGITQARQILELTICEPALGSGAFLNEAINQLAAEYLRRRQDELGESLDPDRYRRELQKVKAHFALHQSYGVDLNSTAVELAEVSLWLNCMHPGLKAPWFGLQLRRGNSLVGCRRSTWRASQLANKPWAKVKRGEVVPPADRPLTEELDDDEIHHFLLPGDGWAVVCERNEAKELHPEETKLLRAWRADILKAPGKADAKRLQALAFAAEDFWARAAHRIRLTQEALRRPIDVYGATVADGDPKITRAEAERILGDSDSALGRLRALMDAWVGLWFWPLDTGVNPPSWKEWLAVAEELLTVDESHGPTGQLGFDDLATLLAHERAEPTAMPISQLREQNAWLSVATDAAKREGAWHWELEYAPVFQAGRGFALQVGNPPWVRPRWYEDLVLAEFDPWWGVTERPSAVAKQGRRRSALMPDKARAAYGSEVASAEGLVKLLSSPVCRPSISGTQVNLYMVFLDTIWRHLPTTGVAGLLHQEGHFVDPHAGAFRAAAYRRLRLHAHFQNELKLFEEINNPKPFSLNIYATARNHIEFRQLAWLYHPSTLDDSLVHDGNGALPGIKDDHDNWDRRPHAARVVTVNEDVLSEWLSLFDVPGTPAAEARLLRPVTRADLEGISVLAGQTTRLADHAFHWTRGYEEDRAKKDGTLVWDTRVPPVWEEVVLQGPHYGVANPYDKQPNEHCRSNRDYSSWELENLDSAAIPRTNYQRACTREEFIARGDFWDGRSASTYDRLVWRRMADVSTERTLYSCLVARGAATLGSSYAVALEDPIQLAQAAGLFASIPYDYLTKIAALDNLHIGTVERFPLPQVSGLTSPVALRVMRLNCLTNYYAPLWAELYDQSWRGDFWTDSAEHGVALGDVQNAWSVSTPLRFERERRQALVELDALAALMLGLSADQLCAMYRTQFAVLRKYERRTVFDAAGRRVCAYHQSAGSLQAELQERAKRNGLPREWLNAWNLYEQYENVPTSVDWLGYYTPPFYRPDREKEMTRAYEEFERRLEAGEYG